MTGPRKPKSLDKYTDVETAARGLEDCGCADCAIPSTAETPPATDKP